MKESHSALCNISKELKEASTYFSARGIVMISAKSKVGKTKLLSNDLRFYQLLRIHFNI